MPWSPETPEKRHGSGGSGGSIPPPAGGRQGIQSELGNKITGKIKKGAFLLSYLDSSLDLSNFLRWIAAERKNRNLLYLKNQILPLRRTRRIRVLAKFCPRDSLTDRSRSFSR